MSAPTPFEQEMLELVNRARANPAGEFDALIVNAATQTGVTAEITAALRYFNVDLALFKSQIAGLAAVNPLAWNNALGQVARTHSAGMIAADSQTHFLPGEASLATRASLAGYQNMSRYGENIFAYTEDPVQGQAGFFIDWGIGPGGMQSPAGHRNNILNAGMTEVGIGAIADSSSATQVGPWVVTQDFASRTDYAAQLVGVVIDDADADAFYDAGEGQGGITVTAVGTMGRFTTTTWAAGGYQMVLAPGSYTVTFSGGALDGTIVKTINFGTANLKLDALADEAVGSNLFIGTTAAEQLTGSTGDDLMVGVRGADTLTGLAGNDILIGEFTDARFDAVAAQVYRLYRATLDRTPDAGGQLAWTARLLAGGIDLQQAAAGFVASAEFQARYGATSNAQFVTLLYDNVLDRAPDAGGLASWVAALDAGRSRSQVVAGFSESAEFQNRTEAAALAVSRAGVQADWTDDVYRLYQAALDRAPDAGGLQNWTGALANGRGALEVAAGFVNSVEFQNRYGTTTNTQFITLLYNNVLDRAPDAAGLASWAGALTNGNLTRTDVLRGFAQSQEFVSGTTTALTAFMRGLGVDDRLVGGTGNNVLMGGYGADTFVFDKLSGGNHQIADLERWDRIELSGFGYATQAEALTHLVQSGNDVVFTDQGVRVVFADTALGQIAADMFML